MAIKLAFAFPAALIHDKLGSTFASYLCGQAGISYADLKFDQNR
jgi:hypothetical protein